MAKLNYSPPLVMFDADEIAKHVDLTRSIAAVEDAFLAYEEGRALKPGLMHIDTKSGEFHVKAGGLVGPRSYFVCKINGGFFENRARYGLPNIIGLIVLSDADTGIPLAIFESGYLTRVRTGAATAVAAKYLARPESRTITICGAGAQAETQLRALLKVLPVERALVWSRSGAETFASRMKRELGMEIIAVDDLAGACRQSDVIVTCTSATHWFLGRHNVAPGAFVSAIGADGPDKQELEPALLASSAVVCDLTDQCSRAGELHHAISADLMRSCDIRGELGAVIAGRVGRQSDLEIIVFDSTGTGLQDVAIAAMVYERHQAGNLAVGPA